MDNNAPHLTMPLRSEDDTVRFAEQVWQHAKRNDVIAMWGDLGVGKTAFVRGFIRAATTATEEVPSPTFTLLQTYDSGLGTIHHFDLYRIEHEDEVLELGIDDAFADGVSLIEWPGNMGRWLPHKRLDLTLETLGDSGARMAKLSSDDPDWQARLAGMDLQG
mgnify:FL=1|jgi:tRNA threonylcarbamoyl adenosine modification protein YjeE